MVVVSFAVLFLAIVANDPKPPLQPSADDPPFVTLQRTGCFGTCPDYTLTVFASGRIQYQGKAFVKLGGSHAGEIGPEQLNALDRAFARADFCHRKPKYDYGVLDDPRARVTYRPRTTNAACPNMSVQHAVDDEAPRAIRDLMRLEDEIDRIVHIEDFIGSESYRKKCFPSRFGSMTTCQQKRSDDEIIASAIKSAEEFIARNGYTSAPPDRNALSHESIEDARNVDELLALRRDTLETSAFGYFEEFKGQASARIIVCFRYKKSSGSARGVSVMRDSGTMRMEHQGVRLRACQPPPSGSSK